MIKILDIVDSVSKKMTQKAFAIIKIKYIFVRIFRYVACEWR